MLSVCLITLNEESSIDAALRSVAPIADEIIVVDTGSTDRTREIAAGNGARVFEFKWTDDFSAPRNFAADQVRGDWAIFLDADEELLPQSCDEVLRCVARDDAIGFTVIRENLKDAKRPDYFTEDRVVRLMRNFADVRFIGRIHEHLQPSLEQLIRRENKKILHSNIRLRHYGYIADRAEDKLRRAVKLLKLELDDRPRQFDYLVEYGRTLLQLNDAAAHQVLGQALTQLHQRKNEPRPIHPLAAALLEYLLTTPANLLQGPISPQDAPELIDRWFSRSPPLLWVSAQSEFASGRFARAATFLERLVEISRTSAYDRSIPFDPRILGADALLSLSTCYLRTGELEKAQQILQLLLDQPTHRTAAERNLAIIEQMPSAEK